MILLDHSTSGHIYGSRYSVNEASWSVSKETYTNRKTKPQKDVVLQFKLHELDSNGDENFWLKVNGDYVYLGEFDAKDLSSESEDFSYDIGSYSVLRESRRTDENQFSWHEYDAEHLVTITIDRKKFKKSADLDIEFINSRFDNSWHEKWGVSALNMFEDNGGTDNGLANWASQGAHMLISKLSPDSDVNSLWNSIESEFDQTATTLQGMVDGTKGNTYFNVGSAAADDISADEIADAAFQIANYLESFFTNDGFGTLDDVAEEMWVSAAGADFISPSENNVGLAGRIFQYINVGIHLADADSWQKLAKGAVGDISGGLLHTNATLDEDSSNQLPDGATLGDELVQGMGNLINEMKGTLSLHLQRAKWEKDQSDIDTIQEGLDALTTASDRFADEYMELTAQLSAMSILFDMFDGESTAQRDNTAYASRESVSDLADIKAFVELGYDVNITQGHHGVNGHHRLVEVREGSVDYAKFDGIDGFDYKIEDVHFSGGNSRFTSSYDFEFA